MIALATQSLLLGLVFCATPGVIAAEALRRGLARGFAASLALQLGSLVGDAVWAASALAGGTLVLRVAAARETIGVGGAAFLAYLSVAALRDAWRMPPRLSADTADASRGADLARADFTAGALLSLGNPFAVAFWLGVGGAVLAARFPRPGAVHAAVFLGSVTAGGVVWAFIFSGVVTLARRRVSPAVFRVINACCAVALAWFALDLVRRLLRP